jgi:hypothetical protein
MSPRSRRLFPHFSIGVGYWLIVECWKCGGGGVARSPILALYAGGSSIPATDIFESMVAVRFDRMLEDGCCFCMAMVVMERRAAHLGELVHYFFLSLAIAPMGKFWSSPFSTNQCLLLYSFDTHTYHFIMSSFFILSLKCLALSFVSTIVVSPY